MKWEQHDNGNGCHRLIIEAAWAELAPDYDDIVAGYTKAGLAGFRPGKVPRSVIEQRFQREIIDELSRRAAQRFGRAAVRDAGVEPLGPVEAEAIECEKQRPLRFQVRFHSLPEIKLPDLGGLQIDAGGADPRDRISLRLLDLVSFEVPGALVRDELVLDGTDGEPGTAAWQAASDRIRLLLILKRIARQEGIEVDEKDVNRRIAEKAEEFGTSTDALRHELEQGGGTARLRDMLLAEHTMEYLMEKKHA